MEKGLEKRFQNTEDTHVHILAMGDKEERRIFYNNNKSTELGSLIPPLEHRDGDAVEVDVRTVDGFCIENNIENIDLLKVDTEGNDMNVLLGAETMLSFNRVKVIQFEYSEQWCIAGQTLAYCISWLSSHKYTTYILTPAGCKRFDYSKWGDYFGYSNFVSVASDFNINAIE